MAEPSRTDRYRRGSWWLCVALHLPSILLFYWFWRPPSSTQTVTGPDVLIDALLIVASVVGAVGLLVLIAPFSADPVLGSVVAAFAGLVLSVAVVLAALSNVSIDWRSAPDWWIFGLAVVCGVCCVLNLRLRGFRLRKPASTAKAVLGGGLISIALALFSFWVQTAFTPSLDRPTLSAVVALEPKGRVGDNFRSVVEIITTNPGKLRTVLIISTLTVCHAPGPAAAITDTEERRTSLDCEYIRPLTQLSWIDPGGTSTISYAVETPVQHPFVDVEFRVDYARGDRLREVPDSERPASPHELGSCKSAQVVALREQSRLKALASQPRYLIYAERGGGGGSTYGIVNEDNLECPPKRNREFEDLFSITGKRLRVEIWMTDKESPPAAE